MSFVGVPCKPLLKILISANSQKQLPNLQLQRVINLFQATKKTGNSIFKTYASAKRAPC